MTKGLLVAVVSALLLPAAAGAQTLEAGLAAGGSPGASLVLAVALGLALRMNRRRRA